MSPPHYKKPKMEDVEKLEIEEIAVEEQPEEEEKEEKYDDEEEEYEERKKKQEYEDDDDNPYVGNASDYESAEVMQQFVRYNKELRKSEGFDVEFVARSQYFVCGIVPFDLERGDPRMIKAAERCIEVAITQHNQDHEDDGKLEFVRIVKMNYKACAGPVFYITLEAKNTSTGVIGIYQTKAYFNPIDDNIEVYLFRPKKLE